MKKIFTRVLSAVIVAALFGLASCKKLTSYDYPASEGTPYEIITNDATYASFKVAVDRANLQELFNGRTEYTFFLPTTVAMTAAGYSPAFLAGMPSADAAILVKNHIVEGKVDVVSATAPLVALSGKQITTQKQGSTFFAEGNDITRVNSPATNAYINVVNGTFTLYNTVLDAVTNYQHVAANSKIDFTLAALARASTGSVNFNSLLSGITPYTLFAPTNQAWIQYGFGGVSNINAAPVATLVEILKYHLVPGHRLQTSFDSVGVPAFGNGNLYFERFLDFRTTRSFVNGVTFTNGATNSGANIVAKNGVLHVVNYVLRPAIAKTTLEQIQATPTLSVFLTALLRASTADPAFNFQTMLSGSKFYTVFAVNNTGMAAAGFANDAAVNAASPADLAKIIKHHIVSRRINHYMLTDPTSMPSLFVTTTGTGSPVLNYLSFGTFTNGASGNGAGTFTIKGATNTSAFTVTGPNTTTSNGILNIIGGVLLP